MKEHAGYNSGANCDNRRSSMDTAASSVSSSTEDTMSERGWVDVVRIKEADEGPADDESMACFQVSSPLTEISIVANDEEKSLSTSVATESNNVIFRSTSYSILESMGSVTIHEEHPLEGNNNSGSSQKMHSKMVRSRWNSMDSFFPPPADKLKSPIEDGSKPNTESQTLSQKKKVNRLNTLTKRMSFKHSSSSSSISSLESIDSSTHYSRINSSTTCPSNECLQLTLNISMKGRPKLQRRKSFTSSRSSAKQKRRSSLGSKFIMEENEAAAEELLREEQNRQSALKRWKGGKCSTVIIVEDGS